MNPALVAPALLARAILPTQSDERLTDLARSGSVAAFEALVARHRRSLVRVCARILGEADAEEAVQEALLRAHEAIARGDKIHCTRAWLHVIARNTALNMLRARTARGEPVPAEGCDGPAVDDRTAERRQEFRALVAAVGALPPRQREAIVMRELEGRSYAEIADRLGASHGAVRQLLNRARASVRRRLAALVPWGPVSRWLFWSPGGDAVGARVGALADGCGPAVVKVCAALVPAAAFGAGGVSVADHTAAAVAHGSRPAPSVVRASATAPPRAPAVHVTQTAPTARITLTQPHVGRKTGTYVRLNAQHRSAPARTQMISVRPAGKVERQESPRVAQTTPARAQPQPVAQPRTTARPQPQTTPAQPQPTTNMVRPQSDQREEPGREDQGRSAGGVRQAPAGD